MKLIPAAKPELWTQEKGFIGMCEHIARCAAICYNSTPKTGGEAVDFVCRLIKMGHGRALEFGTFRANVTKLGATELENLCRSDYRYYDMTLNGGGWSIVTNLRFLIESDFTIKQIEFWSNKVAKENLEGDCEPRVTIHYPAISRAIADEFRTHTTLSTLMQSTRYVNVALPDGNIEFIEPSWYSRVDEFQKEDFRKALSIYGSYYIAATVNGLKRQEARDFLPLCVKTEMVQCGSLKAWDNLIKLRTAKDAHPDAQWMAEKVKSKINYIRHINNLQ